uniref:CHK domain-containing protein n=1 Tax=Globodera pallida TaxID=36090 RepID=A0A183C5H1_GLOPA
MVETVFLAYPTKGGPTPSCALIEQAITALAQFHALSVESPQLCDANTVPTLSHPKPENELVIKEWLLDVLLTLPECDYFRKNELSLRNFLQKVGFGFKHEQIGTDSHKELPIVLCHGNFCVNNIVFCSTDTKCVGKSPADTLSPIILSWELAHPGHGISDVVHLLLSSVNSSVRLQRQDQWIALYVHKFEQFIQLQRKQNRSGKSSMQQMLARKKTMENAVKKQKQKFHALLPGQLLRVLPKLAMEYRKLAETAQLNSEKIGQYNWKRCVLLGRMIGKNHSGHGISDVVHLLLSSVNSSVRLQRQDQWIALYVHKFEQFIQLQRKQNRSGKSSMQQMLARKKTMENAVKQQKQKFRALLPGQLLRVLPKLAMEYRKLAKTAQLNSEQIGQYNWKRCALLGRMIGGFEMVRKDFEKK